MLLLLFLAVFAVYVLVSVCMLFFSQSVIMPLGNRHFGTDWDFKAATTTNRMLFYLPGNNEVPSQDSTVIAFFRDHGWDVVCTGYADSFEVNDAALLKRYDRAAAQYSTTAIWARSIGTCFAAQLCAKAAQPDKILFVAYMTPVVDLAGLINWHTMSVFSPFSAYFPGGQRGLAHHRTAHRRYVIVAAEDAVTPRHFVDAVDAANCRVETVANAGHNDIEQSAAFADVLKRIVVDGV